MDDELEVIHHQMEETRASLADKLEALEGQVLGTVQTATDTVSSAVEGAKEVVSSVTEGTKQVVDKMSETVESVKESLSVSRYVERYPWASLGVSVAAGFALAQLLPSRPKLAGDYDEALPPASSGNYYQESATPFRAEAPVRQSSQPSPAEPRQEEGPSWTSALSGVLGTAAHTVEGLAVGTLMSAIKDLAVSSLPQEWQSELHRVVDDVTTRLGGKVMHGHPLNELLSALQPHHGDGHSDREEQHGPAM